LASLGINGQLFVFQLINFAIVAVIVWFLILKPLTKKMEERRQLIDDSLEKAKEVETNLAMSEKKYQEKIDQAKVEANKIIGKAAEEAVATTEQLKKKAKEEIELLVKQTKRNLEIDKQDMRDEIKKETVLLVTLAVEKILQEKMTGKTEEKFIRDILSGTKV
jgi:F-type H+-transporting ATPase subunit b